MRLLAGAGRGPGRLSGDECARTRRSCGLFNFGVSVSGGDSVTRFAHFSFRALAEARRTEEGWGVGGEGGITERLMETR